MISVKTSYHEMAVNVSSMDRNFDPCGLRRQSLKGQPELLFIYFTPAFLGLRFILPVIR